jgi:prophage DNA circulation protein
MTEATKTPEVLEKDPNDQKEMLNKQLDDLRAKYSGQVFQYGDLLVQVDLLKTKAEAILEEAKGLANEHNALVDKIKSL